MAAPAPLILYLARVMGPGCEPRTPQTVHLTLTPKLLTRNIGCPHS